MSERKTIEATKKTFCVVHNNVILSLCIKAYNLLCTHSFNYNLAISKVYMIFFLLIRISSSEDNINIIILVKNYNVCDNYLRNTIEEIQQIKKLTNCINRLDVWIYNKIPKEESFISYECSEGNSFKKLYSFIESDKKNKNYIKYFNVCLNPFEELQKRVTNKSICFYLNQSDIINDEEHTTVYDINSQDKFIANIKSKQLIIFYSIFSNTSVLQEILFMKNLASSTNINSFFALKENISECISLLICKLMDLISYIKCTKKILQNDLVLYDLFPYKYNNVMLIKSEIEFIPVLRNNTVNFITEYENNKVQFFDSFSRILDTYSWESLTTRFVFIKIIRILIKNGCQDLKSSIVALTKKKECNYKALFDNTAINLKNINTFFVSPESSFFNDKFYLLEIDKVYSWIFFRFLNETDFYAMQEIQNKIKISEGNTCNLVVCKLNSEMKLSNIRKLEIISTLLCPSYYPSIRCLILLGVIYTIKYQKSGPFNIKLNNFFLLSKGKWLNFDLEKNKTLNFALFISNLDISYFEKIEYDLLTAVRNIGMLIRHKNRKLIVKHSYLNSLFEDKKIKCKFCEQWRSLSLFIKEECIICYKKTKKTYLDEDNKKSFMKKCNECYLIYVVVKFGNDKYNNGMCYSCKKIFEFEKYRCLSCMNLYMYLKDGKCVICSFDNWCKKSITIKDFILQNGAEYIGLNITNTSKFFSLDYKLEKENKDDIIKIYGTYPKKGQMHNYIKHVKKSYLIVINFEDTRNQTIKFLNYMEAKKCTKCKEESFLYEMKSFCGRSGCILCIICISKGYLEVNRGKLIKTNYSKCFKCKKNLLLEEEGDYDYFFRYYMLKRENILTYNENMYGVCQVCKKVDVVLPHELENFDFEQIIDYKCLICREIKIIQCPECKIWMKKPYYNKYFICRNLINSNTRSNKKCGAERCCIKEKTNITSGNNYLNFISNKTNVCDNKNLHSYKKDYDIILTGDVSFDWCIEEERVKDSKAKELRFIEE